MKILTFSRYASCSFVAAMLASCGVLRQAQDTPPIGAQGAMPQNGALLNVDGPARPASKPDVTKAYLYVGTLGNTITVYPLNGSKPIRQIHRRDGVRAMAPDPWGDVYTTDGDPSAFYGIIAYRPGGNSTLLKIASFALAIAFDSAGNFYEADGTVVAAYVARTKKRLRVISDDTRGGDALAFDPAGNLYLGREGASSSAPSSVTVFPPDAKKPSREITDGVRRPYALLIDNSGDLVVSNCAPCYYPGSGPRRSSITEYAPGSSAPFLTITEGVDTPIAMAVGRGGLLFVAYHPYLKKGAVTVYGSSGTLIRTITAGIDQPDSLAVDSDGKLYVANSPYRGHAYSITVYSSNGARLLRTITAGLRGAHVITIGKQ